MKIFNSLNNNLHCFGCFIINKVQTMYNKIIEISPTILNNIKTFFDSLCCDIKDMICTIKLWICNLF